MATQNNIVLKPPRQDLDRAQWNLNRTKNYLEGSVKDIEDSTLRLKKTETEVNAYYETKKAIKEEVTLTQEHYKTLKLILAEKIEEVEGDFSDKKRTLKHYQERNYSLTSQLANIKQEVTRLTSKYGVDGEKTIDRKSLRAQLSHITPIKKLTTRNTETRFSMTAELSGMVMNVVNEQKEMINWLTTRIQEIIPNFSMENIPLKDIKVSLIYDKENGYTKYWASSPNREQATPHWLSPRSPCMGDFGAPIQEAMASFDFVSAWEILIEYLTTYNFLDMAGQSAIRWAISNQEVQVLQDCGIELNYRRVNERWIRFKEEDQPVKSKPLKLSAYGLYSRNVIDVDLYNQMREAESAERLLEQQLTNQRHRQGER
jgi:hypothetical protein